MANTTPVYERHVSAETQSTPEFQSTFQKLGQSESFLGDLGAKVAQNASNQMAAQMGYEAGKNPHGTLNPSITEFDKNFTDAYNTQAQATLNLQGQKLLSDTQVEMSKPMRLTPDMIARTNQQLSKGLSKIADQAPYEVKSQLEATFASQALAQNSQYQHKMISDQREDQTNTIIDALDSSKDQAMELAMNGDANGAARVLASTNNIADGASNGKYITPQTARVAKEQTKQAMINGLFVNEAQTKYHEGKLEEYQRELADGKNPNLKGLTNSEKMGAMQAVQTQMNFLQSMRAQDENLKAQQMLNNIATDPSSITGLQWQKFADSVSKIKAEEVRFKYIQALKSGESSGTTTNELIQDYGNPEAHAKAPAKVRDDAYLKQVDYTVQQSQKNGAPISHEDAEVQVAAASGAEVPVFTRDLRNKLRSGNPAMMDSAAQQMDTLRGMGAGHALVGLDDKDNAIAETYKSLRNSLDPTTAARDAINATMNQDPEVQTMNKQKWSNIVSTATKGGLSTTDFALSKVALKPSDFLNPGIAQVYASDIYRKMQTNFLNANGDENNAMKLTKRYVDENYGDTGVNGGKNKTLHPLEKMLGFKTSDAVPYIQQDVINQIAPHSAMNKKDFDEGKANEYWEPAPLSQNKHGIFSTTYDPIQMIRHTRSKLGTKTEKFDVALQGNSFDGWDITVNDGTVMRNLFQMAPYLGVITYRPNQKAIHESYNKDHSF